MEKISKTVATLPTIYCNLLVISSDLGLAKLIQSQLNHLQKDSDKIEFRIFPGVDKDKAAEYLAKYEIHMIVVEEETLTEPAEKYVQTLRDHLKKTSNNQASPVVLVTTKLDFSKTKNLALAGYVDVFIKPIDQSLFAQKLHIYAPKIHLLGENLLFNMETKQPVDLGFHFDMLSISEYGMKVQSDRSLKTGLVLSVYATFLDEIVVATVQDSQKVGEDNFRSNLLFIGLTPSQTQSIRRFVRREYIEEKQ
jgi:response regulator of citrate/malate metabolism